MGESAKIAIVTGGRSGIGRAVVDRLRASGARVACFDVAADGGEDPSYREYACDVSSAHAVEASVEAVVRHFGGVDWLVQSAGVTRDRVLWKMSDDEWNDVLGVNLHGAFNVMRAVAPVLRARCGGSIVNVSSINGLRGKFGQTNYAASKAGLIGLTKSAARELGGHGIRANVVAPGLVRTPMTADLPAEVVERAREEMALDEVAEPEDVAAAVQFLLSDDARCITGCVLQVDCGQYM